MYIFWFLHQTTTSCPLGLLLLCCISFDSYIKPQRCCSIPFLLSVVYLLIPTSNHNCNSKSLDLSNVVYLLIPTSNHNWYLHWFIYLLLYIFWFLHQTTTNKLLDLLEDKLYIFWFLHQTTTCTRILPFGGRLYIFWFLHQTTTPTPIRWDQFSCISFDSYIKPQLFLMLIWLPGVVYLLIPTSNHNHAFTYLAPSSLYIFWFLHQTTTYRFESTDFQCIPITFSNKKWRVEYNFLCKSTKKTPIESVRW